MTTTTFTPHPDLDKLDPDFRSRWAEALTTSKQARKRLLCSDGKCCLGVACSLEGLADDTLYNCGLPKRWWKAPHSIQAMDMRAANMVRRGTDPLSVPFEILNDGYLTHKEIAQLLRGETVIIDSRRYHEQAIQENNA